MSLAEITCNCVRSGQLRDHLLLHLVSKLENNYKLNIKYRKITYLTLTLLITTILSLAPSEPVKKIHYQSELINWLKNKICRQVSDSYRALKNTRAGRVEHPRQINSPSLINWLKNKICRQSDDSCHPLRNNSPKYIIGLLKLSTRSAAELNSIPAFHACRQAAQDDSKVRVRRNKSLELDSIPAFYPYKEARPGKIRPHPTKGQDTTVVARTTQTEYGLTKPWYLFVNFSKQLQRLDIINWPCKNEKGQEDGLTKPNLFVNSPRRAMIPVIVIKDSSGQIRGRLEPQRGRSLTVKAVCGGTLGWNDPPLNSLLALPGATHQDLTQKEIIKYLSSPKLYYQNDKNSMYSNKKSINKTKDQTTILVFYRAVNKIINNCMNNNIPMTLPKIMSRQRH